MATPAAGSQETEHRGPDKAGQTRHDGQVIVETADSSTPASRMP